MERKYNIATCRSRRDRTYINTQMTWPGFIDKVKETYRTREKVDEYTAMPKSKQADIKDVGGFVAGQLKDGYRNNQSVMSRSMLTLDLDFAPIDFWDTVEMLDNMCCCLYSTHKHTPKKPKYRLIIPTNRDMSPDEYEAVARKVASRYDMDYFDDTTYQPARMMFWPSTSKDGVYEFHRMDGPLLDVDEVLAEYPDWRDISFWPRSSRTEDIRKRSVKKQGDPLEKDGLIGAFCRTYTIQEAIETFIPEVYTPTTRADRWTYVAGSTAGGLVIYDDKFAYSNHATDPCSGKLCNAFDLVRIHKFGDLDADVQPGTPISKYPSWAKMIELCGSDSSTVQEIGEERLQEALEDYKDDFDAVDTSWLGQMETDKKGTYKPTTDNIVIILENDPRLKGRIGGVDLFNQKPVKFGDLPWAKLDKSNPTWTDDDDAGLRYLLEKDYGIVAKGKCDDAVTYVHQHHAFHPVRDYLNSLEWDGQERLDTLFIDYLGSPDTEYVRQATRKAFTAAVARVMHPGCKYDYMVVLIGKQGIGKSHILSIMGGQWFSDSITTVAGKEAYECLHGSWIIEMAELTATRKSDIEQTKQFISKREDRYRKAYARRVTDNPRQCVFFGTTNDTEFLRDYTGNRRFWPIETDAEKATKNIFDDLTPEVRDQLWAEAVVRYKAKESLYLKDEVEQEALKAQEAHTYKSVKEDQIANYLDRKLPENWYDMNPRDRALWIEEQDNVGTMRRDKVCLMEIWIELFNGSRSNFPNAEQREINAILDHLGWERTKNPIWIDHNVYKKQRARRRPNTGNSD